MSHQTTYSRITREHIFQASTSDFEPLLPGLWAVALYRQLTTVGVLESFHRASGYMDLSRLSWSTIFSLGSFNSLHLFQNRKSQINKLYIILNTLRAFANRCIIIKQRETAALNSFVTYLHSKYYLYGLYNFHLVTSALVPSVLSLNKRALTALQSVTYEGYTKSTHKFDIRLQSNLSLLNDLY